MVRWHLRPKSIIHEWIVDIEIGKPSLYVASLFMFPPSFADSFSLTYLGAIRTVRCFCAFVHAVSCSLRSSSDMIQSLSGTPLTPAGKPPSFRKSTTDGSVVVAAFYRDLQEQPRMTKKCLVVHQSRHRAVGFLNLANVHLPSMPPWKH